MVLEKKPTQAASDAAAGQTKARAPEAPAARRPLADSDDDDDDDDGGGGDGGGGDDGSRTSAADAELGRFREFDAKMRDQVKRRLDAESQDAKRSRVDEEAMAILTGDKSSKMCAAATRRAPAHRRCHLPGAR